MFSTQLLQLQILERPYDKGDVLKFHYAGLRAQYPVLADERTHLGMSRYVYL